MKISIIGYYGANFGDLLMLNVLLRSFEKRYDSINIFSYGDIGILDEVLSGNKGYKKYRLISLVQPNALADFRKHVKGSVSLNWGGGTCFMDEGGTGGIKFMLIARSVGVKVNYLGIGIDKHRKLKTRMYIALANMISSRMFYRDVASKHIADKFSPAGKYKNQLIPDLAYGHEKIAGSKDAEKYILFCTRNLSGYDTQKVSNVGRDLAQLTMDICCHMGISRITNLICDYEIDLKDANEVKALFLKQGFAVEDVYGYNLEETIEKIASASFVVSVRLHPAVLANNLKVPYAIFNYSDKNLKFAEDVKEKERLIVFDEIKNFKPVYSSPENLIGALNKKTVLEMLNKL